MKLLLLTELKLVFENNLLNVALLSHPSLSCNYHSH